MRSTRHTALLIAIAGVAARTVAVCFAHTAEREIEQAKQLWAKSPHGAMLVRILPPAMEPDSLPEPRSGGAQLTVRYCVQCHHLVNHAMHAPRAMEVGCRIPPWLPESG